MDEFDPLELVTEEDVARPEIDPNEFDPLATAAQGGASDEDDSSWWDVPNSLLAGARRAANTGTVGLYGMYEEGVNSLLGTAGDVVTGREPGTTWSELSAIQDAESDKLSPIANSVADSTGILASMLATGGAALPGQLGRATGLTIANPGAVNAAAGVLPVAGATPIQQASQVAQRGAAALQSLPALARYPAAAGVGAGTAMSTQVGEGIDELGDLAIPGLAGGVLGVAGQGAADALSTGMDHFMRRFSDDLTAPATKRVAAKQAKDLLDDGSFDLYANAEPGTYNSETLRQRAASLAPDESLATSRDYEFGNTAASLVSKRDTAGVSYPIVQRAKEQLEAAPDKSDAILDDLITRSTGGRSTSTSDFTESVKAQRQAASDQWSEFLRKRHEPIKSNRVERLRKMIRTRLANRSEAIAGETGGLAANIDEVLARLTDRRGNISVKKLHDFRTITMDKVLDRYLSTVDTKLGTKAPKERFELEASQSAQAIKDAIVDMMPRGYKANMEKWGDIGRLETARRAGEAAFRMKDATDVRALKATAVTPQERNEFIAGYSNLLKQKLGEKRGSSAKLFDNPNFERNMYEVFGEPADAANMKLRSQARSNAYNAMVEGAYDKAGRQDVTLPDDLVSRVTTGLDVSQSVIPRIEGRNSSLATGAAGLRRAVRAPFTSDKEGSNTAVHNMLLEILTKEGPEAASKAVNDMLAAAQSPGEQRALLGILHGGQLKGSLIDILLQGLEKDESQ